MAIQNRRGIHTDFDATKMVAGEFAVVKSGDPNNTNGTSVYICFQNGSAKRLVLVEDLDTVVGSLGDLETTDKTSIVDAINELAEKSSILFGTSSTTGATRDKVVTCADFEAVDGALIAITLSQTNTVTDARFNVNGTGAKSIYTNNDSTGDTSWLTKGTYLFVYNSTNGGRFTLIGATERIASDTAPVMDGTAAVGTSKKYARADHVHPSDTTRATVAALTAETTARTDADTAINGEITQLKEDLSEVTEATRNLNTSNMGRWGNAADGKIYSRNDTYYGMESFVPITAGQTYYVSFGGITSSSAISWTYLFVDDNGTNLTRAGYSNIDGHAITAPSGATKLHIFCKSDNTITISDDAYTQIEKGSSATQHISAISATDYLGRETADKAFQVYNVIDSSTDLDTLPKNGAYRWNTSSVPQHSPVEKTCRLINIPSDANNGTGWIQIVITSDTVMYIRYRITSNWSDWVELASKAYVDAEMSSVRIEDGADWEA